MVHLDVDIFRIIQLTQNATLQNAGVHLYSECAFLCDGKFMALYKWLIMVS